MPQLEHSVFSAALSLPPGSRSRLAELLLDSLASEGTDAEVADEIRSAWVDEANRRMREVDESRVELVPGEQVMERLLRRSQS